MRFFAPPSVLPDISPARGEISSFTLSARPATFVACKSGATA
jgi:hypothetical protein